MAKSTELEFRMPDKMEQRDSDILNYMFRSFKSVVIDYDRKRVKVVVSSRNANKVIERTSKTNFKLEK